MRGGQTRGNQDHQLNQPSFKLHARSKHFLQLECVFAELSVAQPNSEGSPHMAARRHYLIVDPSLLGREFGFVDIWQASHALSFLHYDGLNHCSRSLLASRQSLMFSYNSSLVKALSSATAGLSFAWKTFEKVREIKPPIDYSGSLHNSSAKTDRAGYTI